MNNRTIFWCALLMESGISFWLQNEQNNLEYDYSCPLTGKDYMFFLIRMR